MWYRIFGTSEVEPAPAVLLEQLQALGIEVVGRFRRDDQGWFTAELIPAGETVPVQLERYLVQEEGIRDELNTWAAWLETADYSPNNGRLMQHMISTRQLVTVKHPLEVTEEGAIRRLCVSICRVLADEMTGVYQVDGEGFYGPDGTLLLEER